MATTPLDPTTVTSMRDLSLWGPRVVGAPHCPVSLVGTPSPSALPAKPMVHRRACCPLLAAGATPPLPQMVAISGPAVSPAAPCSRHPSPEGRGTAQLLALPRVPVPHGARPGFPQRELL